MISNLILITDFISAHQADIIYRSGPTPGDFDKLAQFSIVAVILVTINYIFGILIWCIPALLGLIPRWCWRFIYSACLVHQMLPCK